MSVEQHRQWILDSGATTHLARDPESFSDLNKRQCGTLNLANESSTPIAGKGTVSFDTEVFGDKRTVTLSRASHVPDLRANLISVSKIADHGCDVVFRKKGAVVVNADGNIELEADRIGDLYFVRESNDKACAVSTNEEKVSLETLHRRLGHANVRDITDAVRDKRIPGSSLTTR